SSSCIEVALPVAGPINITGNDIHHSHKFGISISSPSHSSDGSLTPGTLAQQLPVQRQSPPSSSALLLMSDNGQRGNLASNSDQICIEFNNLFCNKQSIMVENGAIPTIRHNNIFESERFAIRISELSGGLIEHNNIFSNHRPS